MTPDVLMDDFAPEKRVALAWTPVRARPLLATFLGLDQRLARIVSQASEPMLAQLRLAWWRDELAKPPELRPTGDVVLDAIGAHWRGQEGSLASLVDGWELLLVDELAPHVAENFVAQRADGLAGFAALVEPQSEAAAREAGIIWAAMDASVHASDAGEREMLRAIALDHGLPVLPRALRGLHVLAGLGMRAARRNDPALMAGRGGALAALRLGFSGR